MVGGACGFHPCPKYLAFSPGISSEQKTRPGRVPRSGSLFAAHSGQQSRGRGPYTPIHTTTHPCSQRFFSRKCMQSKRHRASRPQPASRATGAAQTRPPAPPPPRPPRPPPPWPYQACSVRTSATGAFHLPRRRPRTGTFLDGGRGCEASRRRGTQRRARGRGWAVGCMGAPSGRRAVGGAVMARWHLPRPGGCALRGVARALPSLEVASGNALQLMWPSA